MRRIAGNPVAANISRQSAAGAGWLKHVSNPCIRLNLRYKAMKFIKKNYKIRNSCKHGYDKAAGREVASILVKG
jgi:hypothetical protein